MYVCMYVCVCMYACMYVCVCMHVCVYICDRLQENRAQRGVRKIDRFLKNVLFQADGRERLGLL